MVFEREEVRLRLIGRGLGPGTAAATTNDLGGAERRTRHVT